MAIDKHISGAVEKFEDTAGTSHSINAEFIGGYDAREVFPNYGEVKTLNRISNKGYTGSATWYYPLLKLPVDNDGNYASAIVTGRIGGWVASNMSFCQFLIWNRNGEGITCLHMDGKGSTSEATNTADLVVYRNSDNTTTVYIKCNSYFTYDLNVQTYQSNATIIYNGQYSTTAPTGTLKVSGANATTRLELSKNGAVYNGGALALKSDCVPYDNASKDVYLGSHGIHSGTRPSSGSATLMGNGYWIQESSVGVSSAVTGGVAVSSEMTPNYISVSNGKIKINSSGIVSDSGTFTFDGNPGSVATSADLKNYQKKGNYVTIDTAQTITGRKTFNSPANVNGQEVATAIFKTSNGGRLIIGKEGPNSGTMLRFDQTAGTTRLQFRASATPGAMVWTQPEKGATLYFDLTNSAGVSTRTTLDARSGTIARTSDIGNGKITIQKNGTEVGSFTTNQSGSKTINLTLGVSDVSGLQSTLNGKMDTYTITSSPSSMGKNGFAQFGYDIRYQLTRYSQLQRAFGYVRAVEKGGEVSNNNSYFTGFGEIGGGTYIGTATYDRDYNSTTDALYTSHGLLIDAYGSAFLLSGSKNSETMKELATKDDTNSLQNSINGKANVGHTHAISEITNLQSTLNGKQATLVSGTNIKTINGNSILGSGNLSLAMSIAQKSINNDIINATSTKSCYVVIDNWLVQWGVFIGAYGDTTNWEVTFPKAYYWYPAVILQTKDTITNNQGIPYSNGAVVTSNDGGASFTFQLRRSEICPVYWIAIGGLH